MFCYEGGTHPINMFCTMNSPAAATVVVVVVVIHSISPSQGSFPASDASQPGTGQSFCREPVIEMCHRTCQRMWQFLKVSRKLVWIRPIDMSWMTLFAHHKVSKVQKAPRKNRHG